MTDARDFEARVLPHLDAAFNLARWLTHDHHVAEDMVQEAYLKAFRYFDSARQGDVKPWLMGIVRNNCYTWMQEKRIVQQQVDADDDLVNTLPTPDHGLGQEPGRSLDQGRLRKRVNEAIGALAPPFREVIVLRELEGLSYEEIAQIASIPIGTVMSRLSRARAELKTALSVLKGN